MRNTTLKLGAMAIAIAILGTGCASMESGMSDEDAIRGIISKFETALMASDLDSAFMLIADDFEMSDGLNKADYKEFLTQLQDAGQFDDMEINAADLAVTVEDDKAEAMPLVVIGAFGEATLEFELENRDGMWVVTYINQIVG